MSKPMTGRKVLYIALAAFGTVIAANITLAVAAVETFPGLEVKNGYVASQRFEADRAAQLRLGWAASATYTPGALHIALQDAAGDPVGPDTLIAKVGRPTGRAVDKTDLLMRTAEGFTLPLDLDEGRWRIDLLAHKGDDQFRQHLTIQVTK